MFHYVNEVNSDPFKYHFQIMNLLTLLAGGFTFFVNLNEDWKRKSYFEIRKRSEKQKQNINRRLT